MGLDNGIDVKVTEEVKFKFNEIKDWDNFCYWRKCWDIREIMIGVIKDRFYTRHGKHVEENSMVKLTPIDIYNFRKALFLYMQQSYDDWLENYSSGTIWDYNNCMEREGEHIAKLTILLMIMDKYPDTEVYFYDSY